ncbi:putative damage-inducible protein DinB [Neobacillus niacini]|uniref:DinB family protein n=1 Tax=Neobacillus driksii TaxID=3035913 RepID=UPI0027834455|nr:DinB family protein [Neobacillus niacini]MDQ0972002.1 putative damage-inducible protein DinB [Neobacillus niacini]
MMNRKDVLLEQFLCCQKKSHWFVSFEKAVAGLTPEQALWKKSDCENSIWEIISHLVFWNKRFLNRFKNSENPKMDGNNDSTFAYLQELEWEQVLLQYNQVMIDWYETIEKSEDEKFDESISEQSKETWLESISSITLHNAYHIGQIVTIRKLQGSWNKEQGVS